MEALASRRVIALPHTPQLLTYRLLLLCTLRTGKFLYVLLTLCLSAVSHAYTYMYHLHTLFFT
uniref:Uncharacterized protein n=1 Tax=Octopus bimaculoides TaxID=37653 RepID=A0A0L8HFW5_OCTBM